MLILAIGVFYITDARTDFAVMLLLLACVFIIVNFPEKSINLLEAKWLKTVLIFFPIFMCLLIWMLTSFYNDNSVNLVRLNESFLSNRLLLGKQGIDDYGISFFGNYVIEVGYGGRTDWPGMYYFLDSSFISIGIKYGIVFLALMIFMMVKHIIRLQKEKEYIWEIVIIILILQCFMEHHFIQYWYNPFLMLIFSKIIKEDKKENKLAEIIDLNL